MQASLAILSGSFVGFSLGLIGSGGSILAVPLLLYVVGVRDAHVAIGTSALAVAVNAFVNLAQHAFAGNVKWPCASVFALAGLLGAILGSSIGKEVDGQSLLALFAIVMLIVAAMMFRRRASDGNPAVRITPRIAGQLVAIALGAGLMAGFFGIGGGFLIVPGIMLGSGMPILNAIGSSLLSVGTFAVATAITYARSDLIDWELSGFFIGGGVLGGMMGMKAAVHCAQKRDLLVRIFGAGILVVALYMLWRSFTALAL